MLSKITFLCVTPLEGFLTPAFQSCVREYYQWLHGQVLSKNIGLQGRECIEIYGESGLESSQELFEQLSDYTQILYVQSRRIDMVKKVFEKSDLVIMGISGCRKEFDKTFMPIFQWKDQILFFWDDHICKGADYIRQICNEYRLREEQLIELKRDLHGQLKT